MDKDINRRKFIALVSGAGSILVSSCAAVSKPRAPGRVPEGDRPTVVPRRPFGKTGVSVSKLSFGGASVVGQNSQSLLDEALRLGIDCWEFTAFTSRAFGDYFKAHPGVRERVFLSAKARSPAAAGLQEDLDKSLAANETSVIDLFLVHGVDDVSVLTDEVRGWAERAKQAGKIRYFGFCTHKRMDACLDRAAELGWIDGIQTAYNYRMQAIGTMERAMQRCHAKGIGLFTIKSMGLGVRNESELHELSLPRDKLLADHGLSFEQAKLKAAWQNPHLTSVCSLMPSVTIMRANAAAAMDEQPLHGDVARGLADYAGATGRTFCRRCGLCDAATADRIPVSTVMESLMYARGYGARDLARKVLAQIPAELREKMSRTDYSTAESRCPQKMPIGQLMREAHRELG